MAALHVLALARALTTCPRDALYAEATTGAQPEGPHSLHDTLPIHIAACEGAYEGMLRLLVAAGGLTQLLAPCANRPRALPIHCALGPGRPNQEAVARTLLALGGPAQVR